MSHTIFAPHGMCMMWNQSLIWLHVITDALVAMSYYSIPAALFLVVKKRPAAIPFRPLIVLFALFIAFCGAGHIMDIVSIWKPIYWIKGYWNVGTALTSVVTAFVLIPKVAGFLQIPEHTARLEHERQMLEERHGLLQSVLDSVSEGILLVGESGRPLAYNQAACSMLGASLAVNWDEHKKEDRQIVERQDGTTVERSAREIAGIGSLYVLRDITEERRANASLHELQNVIATMRQGFATVSMTTCRIVSANNALAGLHGYGPDELIGLPAEELLAGTERERRQSMAAILEATERVHFWEGEVQSRRKDESEFPSSLRVNRHKSGAGQLLSVIQTDITSQKRIEAEAAQFQTKLLQSQKLESLGVLAGGVAHDFNNLLTGILGNSSLVVDALGPASPLREYMRHVIRASERASDLTRQLLAYSGKGRFIVEPVDLSALAQETRSLVQLSVPKSVQLQMNLARGLPLVEADSSQLQQLLMNLVINAAEAIGEEPGSVQVTTGTQLFEARDLAAGFASDKLKPGQYCFVEVQDTGCGMDESTKSQIFDPFFTTKFTGRGLGLAAALGIVRGHGGTIKVYSVPGMGSTFKIFLPAWEGEAPEGPVTPLATQLTGAGTVLVVDDEELVRNTACSMLTHYGYNVVIAENGLRAVELFERSPTLFAAVLLDLTMPVMGGEEALRRLQKLRPEIPVVLTSGFNEQEAVRRFSGRQLSGFLQKPFTSQRLAQSIRKALGEALSVPSRAD